MNLRETIKKELRLLTERDFRGWTQEEIDSCCDGEILAQLENTPCCDHGGMISTGVDDTLYGDFEVAQPMTSDCPPGCWADENACYCDDGVIMSKKRN